MKINIPKLSFIALIGVANEEKSTFIQKHFSSNEMISLDYYKGVISNDKNAPDTAKDAFDIAKYSIQKRLQRGYLTAIDATNLQSSDRKDLVHLAKKHHVLPVAIVMNQKKDNSRSHKNRTDQHFLELKKAGFKQIFILNSREEIEAVNIIREKSPNDKSEFIGPFDIIGDVHGCFSELSTLLTKLGYTIIKHQNKMNNYGYSVLPPRNRKAIFVGDLVDRGPASNEVLRLAMSMVKNETGLCVIGNHDEKLLKKLNGRDVQIRYGLAETLEQLAKEPSQFVEEVREFLHNLVDHYILDNGQLVIAHAGLKEEMHGRISNAVRNYCMYGETTGKKDDFGLPIRKNWAKEYKGEAMVIYGHTPVPKPEFINNTANIDTGCVFGGNLTALRYPEKEFISVKAEKVWSEPTRPLNLPQNVESKDLIDQPKKNI